MIGDGAPIPLTAQTGRVFLCKWNLFRSLSPSFLDSVRIVEVFGENGDTALVVTEEDLVYGLGSNCFGLLGTGSFNDVSSPARVLNLAGQGITSICCGLSHVVALSKGGWLFVWGDNQYGQLGRTDVSQDVSPKRFEALQEKTVSMVAVGSEFTLALTAHNKIYAWGSNKYDQCSCSGKIFEVIYDPVKVLLPKGLPVAVAAGMAHGAALTSEGMVYVWGKGMRQGWMPGVKKIKAISCGRSHCLALTQHGHVIAWGSPAPFDLVPRIVTGLPRVKSIMCSWMYHISAVKTECGQIYFWGKTRGGNLYRKPVLTEYVTLAEVFFNQECPSSTYL